MDDTSLPGLPAPPPLGASALPRDVRRLPGPGHRRRHGPGQGIAAEFARLGADLAVVSRGEEHLRSAREELTALGARVTTAVCDLRDAGRGAEVFDLRGLPDVLVDNASADFPVPAEDMWPHAWRAVVDITPTGTFLVTRGFGRRRLAAGTPGSVVDVGASNARTGGHGFAGLGRGERCVRRAPGGPGNLRPRRA
ncbi:SDR family NAD(P)-dependent oxidoreductase [Streptomyces sp. 142MFCol3.1]|uniref:SDR family NAD(P)-dependent oxidoreductase n=1 Tax=Streptomyces sp. 142MFCol3.1 TaxID=1172179 RepID=UPI000418283A|nr:SDR family NAD(P)-dependent oxidoreductase [Streptomyces sp. 142MFCol3.1]